MTLPCLITKQSSQHISLVGTEVVAELNQNKKLDQRANSNTIFSLTICHCISLNINTAENLVNTDTKKDLPEKLSWNALSVVYFCAL